MFRKVLVRQVNYISTFLPEQLVLPLRARDVYFPCRYGLVYNWRPPYIIKKNAEFNYAKDALNKKQCIQG